jgi:hypothetical protein
MNVNSVDCDFLTWTALSKILKSHEVWLFGHSSLVSIINRLLKNKLNGLVSDCLDQL